MFSAKFSRTALILLVVVSAICNLHAAPTPTVFFYENTCSFTPITLNAGTNVTVSLNQEVNVNDVAVGNALEFIVRSDVSVAGRVVIAAGAAAVGMVTKVDKTPKGLSLTITVESVLAVDGQTVNLNSIPHVINATKGGATANIGQTLSARVRNNIKINA